METCIVNLVEPGEKVIVCRNGVFGGRMIDMVKRCGGIPIEVDSEWGTSVNPEDFEIKLTRKRREEEED